MTEFTGRVVAVLSAIPPGKATSYGAVSRAAGSPGSARQVVRVLHSMSRREKLPWHRVVNARRRIALKDPAAADWQRHLLEQEGCGVSAEGIVAASDFLEELPPLPL